MKKRKLSIRKIKIQSFVTAIESGKDQTILGGNGPSSPTGCPMACNDTFNTQPPFCF